MCNRCDHSASVSKCMKLATSPCSLRRHHPPSSRSFLQSQPGLNHRACTDAMLSGAYADRSGFYSTLYNRSGAHFFRSHSTMLLRFSQTNYNHRPFGHLVAYTLKKSADYKSIPYRAKTASVLRRLIAFQSMMVACLFAYSESSIYSIYLAKKFTAMNSFKYIAER